MIVHHQSPNAAQHDSARNVLDQADLAGLVRNLMACHLEAQKGADFLTKNVVELKEYVKFLQVQLLRSESQRVADIKMTMSLMTSGEKCNDLKHEMLNQILERRKLEVAQEVSTRIRAWE